MSRTGLQSYSRFFSQYSHSWWVNYTPFRPPLVFHWALEGHPRLHTQMHGDYRKPLRPDTCVGCPPPGLKSEQVEKLVLSSTCACGLTPLDSELHSSMMCILHDILCYQAARATEWPPNASADEATCTACVPHRLSLSVRRWYEYTPRKGCFVIRAKRALVFVLWKCVSGHPLEPGQRNLTELDPTEEREL